MEYSSGVDAHNWQRFWHFNEDCKDYPTASFAIAKTKPLNEYLCPSCISISQNGSGEFHDSADPAFNPFRP